MRAPTDRARVEALIAHQRSDGRRSLAASFRECDRLEHQVLEDGHLHLELGSGRVVTDAQVYLGGRNISHLTKGVEISAKVGEVASARLELLPKSISVGGELDATTVRDDHRIRIGDRSVPVSPEFWRDIVAPAIAAGPTSPEARELGKRATIAIRPELGKLLDPRPPRLVPARFDESDVEAGLRAERTSRLIDELESVDPVARRQAEAREFNRNLEEFLEP